MILISDTVSLETCELLHSQIIDTGVEPDIQLLVYHYLMKIIEKHIERDNIIDKKNDSNIYA